MPCTLRPCAPRDTARRARRRARAAPRREAALQMRFRFSSDPHCSHDTSLRCAVLYPLADHVDRGLRKIRPELRHAIAKDRSLIEPPPFELLNDEAPVRISGNHADERRILGAMDID